jgi:hypothetical protein
LRMGKLSWSWHDLRGLRGVVLFGYFVISGCVLGSGSFGLPRIPPRPFTVAGWVPGVFPHSLPSLRRSSGMSAAMASCLSFKALLTWLEPLATSAETVVSSSSSLGITRFSPLRCSTVRASTPSDAEASPLGRRYHPTARVPSSWSLTTSTVSSARRLQVCCALLPAMRFVAFPGSLYPRATRR